MRKTEKTGVALWLLAIICLVIGASFHGYRIHPENDEKYNIGVTMGITMLSAFVVFLLTGIVAFIVDRKRKLKKL